MSSRSTSPSLSRGRIEAIDLARGIAVVLMILSHGVKGLLTFEQIPQWGLVPIHLLTKVSSTLFILVFGVSMAVAFVPYVGTPKWPAKRRKLLTRGLVVLFWYKVLTIVEMMQLYTRDDILKTLLYGAFPVYVEILGFYAIALIWVPFFLPLWAKFPMWAKALSPGILAVTAALLAKYFDFWGSESLRALLVEHEKHYTWGQLTRGPLILLGLIIGEIAFRSYFESFSRLRWAGIMTLTAAALGLVFVSDVQPGFFDDFLSIALNEGKHPPELTFMLFSLSGALLVLGLALAGGEKLAAILRPITTIGHNALQSFIFHIVVIFVFYRWLFNYWKSIDYGYALTLTGILVGLTALWVRITDWVKENS